MKQLLFILVFSFISLSSNSQEISILNDDNGQPAVISLRLPDTTYIHHIKDGQIPEHIILGDKYMLSPKELFEHGDDGNHSNYIGNMDSIEPGVLPEADLPYKLKYSPDGTKLIAMYHHTNNLFVYNTETLETLAIVNVGDGPIDMEVNEQHIYVCCYYSDDIYIINLDDYSIEDSFPVEHQPCVLEVNSDESIIYVGFDNGAHCDAGGFLAAYGLSDFNQLFLTYWPFISEMYTSRGGVGRHVYTYSDFLLIGNDNYIASLQTGGSIPIIMNAITGEVEVFFNNMHSSCMATTASKDSLYILAGSSDSLYFYCIDSYTHEVVDSMIVPQIVSLGFMSWQDNLAVNGDGSKLFIEVHGLGWDDYAYMVDFGSHDYKIFDLEDDAQFFQLVSHDGRYVILPGRNLRVFDFETEDYVFDQYQSAWSRVKVNAISPNSYDFVLSDHHHNYYNTHTKRDEYIEVCNFSDPANVIKTDSIFCGETPEADLIFSAVLNNTHEKIITGNPLSGNISIIDASTYEVDTILDIEHISSVVNVGDDLIALSGYHSPYLILFDLSTLSIVREFHLDYYYILIPSPDKQYLYAYSRWDDKLIKIFIDGNNSFIVRDLDILDYIAFFSFIDYTYSPEISPDGKYILFHGIETMKIVDTETMSQVSEVNVSGFGIFDMAFTDDSKRVCIAYWYLDHYFDIIYLDGENSFLENTVYTPAEEAGMSVAFNSIDKKFYLAKKLDIWVVDPETGIVEDTIDFNVKDPQIQIGISPQGEPFVNTYKYLYFDDQEIYLREPTRKFYVDYASQKCIFPSPGPDRVYILDFLTTEIHEIPVSKVDSDVHIYPNPTHDKLTIKSGKLIKRIEIFNASGEKLFDKNFRNAMTTLSLAAYPEGIYFVKIYREEDISVKKVLVVH
jgi:DNA-binding beta-propeller fold protein YncE